MPRKKEATVVLVLDYFEQAPLEAAKLALQLAARAVKAREPKAREPRKPAAPAAGQEQAAPAGPRTSRRKPADVALPGMAPVQS
jgi:hypothetical protein